MGSYYLKKTKGSGWTLYKQSYTNGKRSQERVAELAYLDLGISPAWSYIKAYEAVKQLNKNNSVEKEKIRKAAKRTEEFLSLNEDVFPTELMTKFKEKLEEENFGSDEHLKKIYSHFNFIQQMAIRLRLDARDYKAASKKIYKYFIERKCR